MLVSLPVSAKMCNFQDPTLTSDFDKYCRSTVFHLPEKLVVNHYLEVHRILVPLQMINPLKNLRGTGYVQLIDYIHKNDFDLYDLVTISNFPQKLAQNQYICVAT